MFNSSQFRVVTYGIVAENKKRNTHIVEVLPVEFLPEFSDKLEVLSDVLESRGEDFNGNPYLEQVTRSAFIPAEWLGENNRLTSPDVRRGEPVLIWQAGDADKFYWTVIGRPDGTALRRLETVLYAWSGLATNSDAEFDRSNCYAIEISSHDRHITLSTSKANGEAAAYVIQLNTAEGKFNIEDDLNNGLELDSPGRRWQMFNGDGSFLDLNKEVLSVFTKTEINLESSALNVKMDTINISSSSDEWKTDSYTRVATTNNITGPQTHADPVAFPSFIVGAGAQAPSSPAGGSSIAGDMAQTEGSLTLLTVNAQSAEFTETKAGALTATSFNYP